MWGFIPSGIEPPYLFVQEGFMLFDSVKLRIQVTYKSGIKVYFSGFNDGECTFAVNSKYAKVYKNVRAANKDFVKVRDEVKKLGDTCILV